MVEHMDIKIICGYEIFTELEYNGLHKKLHGSHGLGRNYYFIMDTMLGKGKCEIIFIPYTWIPCTNYMDKKWVPCTTYEDHPIYLHAYPYVFSPILGSFND